MFYVKVSCFVRKEEGDTPKPFRTKLKFFHEHSIYNFYKFIQDNSETELIKQIYIRCISGTKNTPIDIVLETDQEEKKNILFDFIEKIEEDDHKLSRKGNKTLSVHRVCYRFLFDDHIKDDETPVSYIHQINVTIALMFSLFKEYAGRYIDDNFENKRNGKLDLILPYTSYHMGSIIYQDILVSDTPDILESFSFDITLAEGGMIDLGLIYAGDIKAVEFINETFQSFIKEVEGKLSDVFVESHVSHRFNEHEYFTHNGSKKKTKRLLH